MTNPLILRRFRIHLVMTAALALAVAMLLGVVVLHPAHSESDPKAPEKRPTVPPVQVSTTLVKAENVLVTQTGVGNVLPMASVTVRTRIDGQLETVAYKEGQDIKAGQLLARIDPRVYQAQLAQVQAQKAKDQVLLANAQADLQRYTQLIKEEATTQQILDTQHALVAQLQATLKTDDAQISLAQVQLSYTSINAPISGRAGARLVDAGNIVHAADANGLVVINQIDPIAVQFTLPEASFQAVNEALHAGGKPLHVEAIDRLSRQVLGSGELTLLNNQIDAPTGTFTMKARFANPAHKLWPGQSVNARITLSQRASALTVPSPVVQRGQNGYFAFVVEPEGDKVRMQPVQVVQQSEGRSVVEGLAAGDRVVVDGQYRLTPGARVVEVKAATAAATAAPTPTSSVPSGAKP